MDFPKMINKNIKGVGVVTIKPYLEIEDINKCIEIGISNTQLYKQSGNSIPVNILVEIFRNLVGGMFLPGEETKC